VAEGQVNTLGIHELCSGLMLLMGSAVFLQVIKKFKKKNKRNVGKMYTALC